MKIFIKFILLVLVLGLAGPFIMRGPDGRPLLDYRRLIPDFSSTKGSIQRWWNDVGAQVGDVSAALAEDNEETGSGGVDTWGKTRVYRWQDEDGVWQYSDRRPVDAESEVVWFNPNENVVLSRSDPLSEVAEEEDSNAQGTGFELPLPLTVSPSNVPQLIEDTKQVKELMKKRNEILESVSGKSN